MGKEPLTVQVKRPGRNRPEAQLELCVSSLLKWGLGIASTLVTASIVATLSMLFNIMQTQASFGTEIGNIHKRLDKIDKTVEGVRADPFTGEDAKELKQEMLDEIDRNRKWR